MTIHQTAPLLSVSDIVESHKFYSDGLGFNVTKTWEPDGKLTWCWLQHGGAALMLQQACADDPTPGLWGEGVTIYFVCDDADIVYREITARGVKATKPTLAFYGMNQTFMTDPDGYRLCFENPTAAA